MGPITNMTVRHGHVFSTLLILWSENPPDNCIFTSQRPVLWSFDVYYVVDLSKLLNEHSSGRWFETSCCSGNDTVMKSLMGLRCLLLSGYSVTKSSANLDPFELSPQTTLVNVTHKYIWEHYSDVIMGRIASQITGLTIVYSTIYSDADQRKHQSSASLAYVWGIHRGPVNSPYKWPVARKMFLFDDVIMK